MFSGVRVVVMSAQQLLLLSLREFDQLILQQVEKTSGALLHFLASADTAHPFRLIPWLLELDSSRGDILLQIIRTLLGLLHVSN